ncbi:hypothetical protein ADK90_34870 [Streptomyces sp. XY413]|uniref:DUF262 domain-containing protein n=1 Tax=Streptomyces sp. XY413 TaxID=1519479 RepID=UPI00061FF2FB|nr:DUF262 domain-containing protein [Streptomyces sp. XY413]KJY40148.1 hypothetical protein VR46_28315 [Streptomyces sp. NRRL S-444]KOV14221.1 hypothetical protein ADK90_34870 [Streptomyces sp. XY413]
MQAKETLFADLVQGRAQQFQVPLYQRTYSWTEKQLSQLWSDILEQAELVESGEPASTHFSGLSCLRRPRRTRRRSPAGSLSTVSSG